MRILTYRYESGVAEGRLLQLRQVTVRMESIAYLCF